MLFRSGFVIAQTMAEMRFTRANVLAKLLKKTHQAVVRATIEGVGEGWEGDWPQMMAELDDLVTNEEPVLL